MEKLRFSIKKMLAVFAAVFMIAGTATPAVPVVTAAAAKSVNVYLTVSNKGALAKDKNKKLMVDAKVTAKDLNKDGKINLDEVLVAAHKKYNSEKGYAVTKSGSYDTVSTLWGVKTTSTYFLINDAPITAGVTEVEVKKNDHIYAVVNTDPAGSDYSVFFDKRSLKANTNNEITLTLKGHSEPIFPPVEKPVEGVTVKTSDGKILGKTDSEGKVTFSLPKKGKYIITASGSVVETVPNYDDWPNVTYDKKTCPLTAPACTIEVKDKKASKVTVNGKSSMFLDGEQKLTATIKPANASFKDVTWKSSNPKIATVDKTGKVKAGEKTGKVTITAKVKGKSGKLKINVKYAPLQKATAMVTKINGKPAAGGVDVFGTTLDPEKAGTTLQYSVNLQPKTTDTRLKWSSSNKKVAKVSNNGLVTIKGEGKAKITVKQKSGKEVGYFTVQGFKK